MKKLTTILALVFLATCLITATHLFSAQEIYKTWEAATTIYDSAFTNASYVDGSSDMVLNTNGYEGCVVTVYVSAWSTADDDLIVSVFSSYDGTNYDTIEYQTIKMANTSGSAAQASFIVRDLMDFRIRMKGTGGTTQFTLKITADPWRWKYN
jgi:hypothetical protein